MFHRGGVVPLLLVIAAAPCGCRTESGAMEVLCESPKHVDLEASKNIAMDSWLWAKDRLRNRTLYRWFDEDLAGYSWVAAGRALRERAADLGLVTCPVASVYDLELDPYCKKKPNDEDCRLEQRIIDIRIRKLGRWLRLKDPLARIGVISALVRIGARAAPAQKNLIKLLADSHEEIRPKAAQAVIQLGPDAVYKGLKWVVTNPKISREQKTEIYRRFFKAIDVMVPAAQLGLKDPDHRVRGLFAEMLWHLEGNVTLAQRKAAAKMLIDVLKTDQNVDARASAAIGLRRYSGAGLDREAVRALTRAVDRPLLDGKQHDPKYEVAETATRSLGLYPEPLVRATLERLARKYPDVSVRDSAKNVLNDFDKARRRENVER